MLVILLFVIFSSPTHANEICRKGNLEVIENDFFTKLSVPNCTEEILNEKFACECANDLSNFFKDEDLKVLKKG